MEPDDEFVAVGPAELTVSLPVLGEVVGAVALDGEEVLGGGDLEVIAVHAWEGKVEGDAIIVFYDVIFGLSCPGAPSGLADPITRRLTKGVF